MEILAILYKEQNKCNSTKTDYDSREHSQFKALSIYQPYAGNVADRKKPFEIRSRNTTYRGDLVICSTKTPEIEGLLCGAILCIVELYGVVLFKDLTDIEKAQTQIPQNQWKQLKNHYAWKFRNVRRVIEKPVKGGQGMWTLYCTDDYVLEYPEELGERVQTREEIKRDYVNKVKEIQRNSRRGLLFLLGAFLTFLGVIFLIIKFILWLVGKFA